MHKPVKVNQENHIDSKMFETARHRSCAEIRQSDRGARRDGSAQTGDVEKALFPIV